MEGKLISMWPTALLFGVTLALSPVREHYGARIYVLL